METLRSLLRRLLRRKAASAAAALAAAGALAYARVARERSRGTLTEPVARGPIVEAVYGIGTVTASRTYQIKVGVVQNVRALHVREGDAVRAGAELLDLDGVLYRAPFAGTVTFLPYKPGENVFAQVPILTLVDLSDRYVVVSFEQPGALRVLPGMNARLSFDTQRQRTYDGVVRSVYSHGGSFLARVDAGGLPPNVLPEMTADVAIEIRTKADALVVPAAALDRGAVWVKRGRALPRRVPVTVGLADGDKAEIAEGDVLPGDRLLIRGGTKR